MNSSPAESRQDYGLIEQSLSRLIASAPVLIAIGGFVLLWPTAKSLLAEWRDESQTTTYTHGYLIAALCLWLLFRNRSQMDRVEKKPSVIALTVLIATSVLWLAAVRAGIQTVHQVLLPVLIWLAVCSALGLRAALISSFGIAYLYFAVPIWGHINGALQAGTVLVVEFGLRLTGVTAYVEGNFVHLASGLIEIAHGCSGLHYFIVATAIGALYGEVHRDPIKLRVQQMLLAMFLALVTNWVRVYIIILAGYLTEMRHYLVSESHYTFGWCVFAVAMALYFVIVRRLQPDAASGEPRAPISMLGSQNWRSATIGLAFAFGGLAAAPLWDLLMIQPVPSIKPSEEPTRMQVQGWSGPTESPLTDWDPVFIGADHSSLVLYSRQAQRIEVYAATYASQSQGKELVGYKNSLLGNGGTDVIARSKIEAGGPAAEMVVRNASGSRSVIWYFYRVGSLQTEKDVVAQSWFGLTSLVGAPLSRVVALRTACTTNCDEARTQLRDFVENSLL